MKKILLVLPFTLALVAALCAQTIDTTQTIEQHQEPSLNQQLILYGLTAVGLVFLYLSFKQSKWGKKP